MSDINEDDLRVDQLLDFSAAAIDQLQSQPERINTLPRKHLPPTTPSTNKNIEQKQQRAITHHLRNALSDVRDVHM